MGQVKVRVIPSVSCIRETTILPSSSMLAAIAADYVGGSEVDDGAGQGAGDPVRELHSGDHHLAQVVDTVGLDLNDHVLGAGDVGGGDDPLERRNLGGHMSRPAHLGLDEHIRPDGHGASSQAGNRW